MNTAGCFRFAKHDGWRALARVAAVGVLLWGGMAWGAAGEDGGGGEEAATVRYAWLDETRLFMISSDAEFLSKIHPACAQLAFPGGKLAGILVADYDVVPPWNGSVRLGTFPAWPRPSQSGEAFWLGDVGIPAGGGEGDGEENWLEGEVFVYDWLEKEPRAWTPGPWLLRTRVDGWGNANLLKTLLLLPEGAESIDRIRYKGEWVPLRSHAGTLSPWILDQPGSLPAEMSGGGACPAVPPAPGSPPKPAAFYPRDVSLAEAAIRAHPDRAEGYALRAYLEEGLNDEAALRDCNAAIRLAPDKPDLLLRRAAVFFRHGMVFDAYLDASRAAELDPSCLAAKRYYMQAGHIEEAEPAGVGDGSGK